MIVFLCKYCSCVYISSASARIERGRIIEALRQHAAEISSGPIPWAWKSAVIVSSVENVTEIHAAAANLGIEVVEASLKSSSGQRSTGPSFEVDPAWSSESSETFTNNKNRKTLVGKVEKSGA